MLAPGLKIRTARRAKPRLPPAQRVLSGGRNLRTRSALAVVGFSVVWWIAAEFNVTMGRISGMMARYGLQSILVACGGTFTGGLAFIVQGQAYGFDRVPIAAIVPAFFVGAVSTLVIMALLERNKRAYLARLASEKKFSFLIRASIDNMSQGLLMIDAEQEIAIINRRYIEIHGLSANIAKHGCTYRDLLIHQRDVGTFDGDVDRSVEEVAKNIAAGRSCERVTKMADGRVISVVSRTMSNGWLVATYEDVTEKSSREGSFRLLFEGNPVPMWVIDRSSLRFLAVNEAAIVHYGYSREQFLAMTVPDVRIAADHEHLVRYMRGLPDTQLIEKFGKHRKADGTEIEVAICSRTLRYNGHDARMAVIHDITMAKLAEGELRQTKKFLDTVIEQVPVPILVKDVPAAAKDAGDCRYSLINRAYEKMAGISRDQFLGKTARDVFPQDRANFIVAVDTDAMRMDRPLHLPDHSMPTSENGSRIVSATKVAIRDNNQKPLHILSVVSDVTQQRRQEQNVQYIAHHDALTGLPNRTAFNNQISSTLADRAKSGKPFSLLSMDLDHFKEINDAYGHVVGDALLGAVARRIKARSDGAFVARLGGDEFMIIVTDGPQPEAARMLANRLSAAFAEDIEVDCHQLHLGLSVGGAVYPADGTDVKSLMSNADAALYQVKVEMRGTVKFFESSLGNRLRERRELQNDLRLGVQRGELFLQYQPQSRMTGEVTGFEALVRWQCPDRGLVPPDTFIPIAEDSSLILAIGEWVLREACREAASWERPLQIAVNISPIQFRHGDLPRLVHSILLETGLSAARLELEITENVLIGEFSRVVAMLNRLKSLGVKIAMDDFGSGYSSLSYLHAYPFDKIKIDRSFIGDLECNHHSQTIVRAVIGLCHGLNVPILAEGIETQAQHAFLLEEGCDAVQGYLIGRPGPIADYGDLIGRPMTIERDRATAVG